MANIDVSIQDNSKQVLSALEEQILLALDMIGNTAEGYAKEQCPVETGRLRNSISYRAQDDAVYIGTNVEYAPAFEYRDIPHKTGNAN